MLRILLIFSVFFFAFANPFNGPHGGCHSKPYYGSPNTIPFNEMENQKKLIKEVKNGKLYRVTVPQAEGVDSTTFDLVHLWGTPYEMGFAYGSLHEKEFLKEFIDKAWRYLEDMVESVMPDWIPKWLQDLISNLGLEAALDLTYDVTKKYTNKVFYEEMQGIADASGVDFKNIVRIHMLPGVTQGACSMVGAWGSSVDHSKTSLLQLRALDWDMDSPFIEFPQVNVYHPNEGNGHAFVTVGMVGMVGALTGMSSARLGISEIGVSFPDDTFGKMSRIGLPFIFLLRDILQYDINLQNATNRMINSHRTCDLILGVGDGNEKEFNAFQYSYSVLREFSWDNALPEAEWHPPIEDVVYYGMDWLCPSYMQVLGNLTKQQHGKLSAEVGLSQITAIEESGDFHLAWYALDRDEMWISFGAKKGSSGGEFGYSRQFTHVDCASLWKEGKPNL